MISIPLLGLFLIDDYLKGKNQHDVNDSKIRGLKPFQRIIIQCLLTIYMIIHDVYLNLLELVWIWRIELGIFSIPFTVFCVVGMMNAFNMIDGINGLCSGSAMLSLLFIGFTRQSMTQCWF